MAKKKAAAAKSIPGRADVPAEHTWDLRKLFKSDAAWDRGFEELGKLIPGFNRFRGQLGKSARHIRSCCEFEVRVDQLAERLGAYAYLRMSEDVANPQYQGMVACFTHMATQAGEAASFIAPELQAIPRKKMAAFMASKDLAPYRFQLEQLLRYRPHILSENEERLLAMQGEVAGSAGKIFGQLNDADLKFGFVTNEKGEKIELSQSSLRGLLESPRRSVRKTAFHQFYGQYGAHANTLAATLSSSVLQDVYRARARNYPSAREGALFGDNVPVAVYDNLIETVHDNLPVLHRYLALRKRALKLPDLHMYDTYAPLVREEKTRIPYEAAVDHICAALQPLGAEYVNTMRKGLLRQRWVDRYENEGKRSGAFSYGVYQAPPFILMNYKDDVLDSAFTLAHEAGHSMHSHYSGQAQPYQYAHYTIFVAEVASTFNEQLLGKHLMERAADKAERARLVCREIDEVRNTLVRQTMFAEFEAVIHEAAEAGVPLTLERFREEYRALLDRYFGPDFVVDNELELECLRIPHFYSAFYVYKYATGLSAAIALSRMVLEGGKAERERYLDFLRGGGSKYPLELLRDAGVNLEEPAPVNAAMARFAELVDELETLV